MNRSTEPTSIIHVVGSFDPKSGGTTEAVARVACHMARVGHSVTVIAPVRVQDRPRLMTHWRWLLDDGVKVVLEPETRWWPRRTGAWLRRALTGDSVVHLHGVWEPSLWRAGKEASRKRCRYVVCPHGMLDSWSRRRSKWKKSMAWAAGAKRMLSGADAIQCLTEHDAQETALVTGRDRIVVIPTGVDADWYARVAEQRPQYYNREVVNTLYLGRVHPKKGLDVLIRALARIPRTVNVVVAGPEEDKPFADNCRQLAATLGLSARLQWWGAVQGSVKEDLLRESDLFVLPSHQEGFSLAILEAMAAGLPVLITDNCHFPEVDSSNAGFVVRSSVDGVAEALGKFCAMTVEERAAMGIRGRSLVCSKFEWQSIAERLLELYHTLRHSSIAARGLVTRK